METVFQQCMATYSIKHPNYPHQSFSPLNSVSLYHASVQLIGRYRALSRQLYSFFQCGGFLLQDRFGVQRWCLLQIRFGVLGWFGVFGFGFQGRFGLHEWFGLLGRLDYRVGLDYRVVLGYRVGLDYRVG